MEIKNGTLRKRFLLLISCAYLVVILAFSCVSFYWNSKSVRKQARTATEGACTYAKELIETYPDFPVLLEDSEGSDYQEIQTLLEEIQRTFSLSSVFVFEYDKSQGFCYRLFVTGDEQVQEYFEHERKIGVFFRDVPSSKELLEVSLGTAEHRFFRYRNSRMGVFYASCYGLEDTDGCRLMVAGEYDATELNRRVWMKTIHDFLVQLLVLAMIIGLTILFVQKKVTEKIGMIMERLAAFSDSHPREYQEIAFSGKDDELSVIAEKLNELQKKVIQDEEKIREDVAIFAGNQAELDAARKIQYGFVKEESLQVYGGRYLAYGTMKTARTVGGDFYDSFPLNKEETCFVIGDVSGKGVTGAMFMAYVKTLLCAKITSGEKIAEVVAALNNEICDKNRFDLFATAQVVIINSAKNQAVIVNAGHNPPVLRKDGKVQLWELTPNLPLGMFSDTCFCADLLSLDTVDELILYTDGVTDAKNPSGEFLGEEGLVQIIREYDGVSPVEDIMRGIDTFRQEKEYYDDVTILSISAGNRILRLKGEIQELERLQAFEKGLGLPEETGWKLRLAVEELFTNIVSHGQATEIFFVAKQGLRGMHFRFIDNGLPFDMTKNRVEKEFYELDQGGMGTSIIQAYCEAEYLNIDGKNVFRFEL